MDFFIGTIHAKTDEKGRIFVPAPFRKILQASEESCLMMRKDVFRDCLVLTPAKIWKEEMYKLQEGLNKWNEEEKDLYRQLAIAESLELDASGRILIQRKYLQVANITHTVCFLGMLSSIELWNPDQLVKSLMSNEEMKSRVKKILGSNKTN